MLVSRNHLDAENQHSWYLKIPYFVVAINDVVRYYYCIVLAIIF